MVKSLRCFSVIVLVALLSSCAKSPDPIKDPYEGYNRAMFRINDFVDKVTLRPVAQLYDHVVPNPVQRGVSNVFANVGEVDSMVNDLLQLKMRYFFVNFWRFVINTTVGVGGLFDVASKAGLEKHPQTFAMTLGYWSGGTESPYLVLPLLGPSTLRGAGALPAEFYMSPLEYIKPDSIYYYELGGRLVSMRAKLLPTDKLVKDAFDPYVFVRNAYLQRQRALLARNQAEPHS